MTALDNALLDLDAAVRSILPYRPRAKQEAVRRAVAAVLREARAEVAGPALSADEELRQALERCAAELGWSEAMLIVNAAGRRLGGSARRAG